MLNRTEQHREMAWQNLRSHQSLTQAKLEGREPKALEISKPKKPVVFYSPELGETELDHIPLSGDEESLAELRMYWKRIPDFGLKDIEVFPNPKGWVQLSYWCGRGVDGHEWRVGEIDVVTTDDDFNVIRFEAYCDADEWLKVLAYAFEMTVEAFREMRHNYGDLIKENLE